MLFLDKRGKTVKNAEAKNEFESLEKQKLDLSFAKERFSLFFGSLDHDLEENLRHGPSIDFLLKICFNNFVFRKRFSNESVRQGPTVINRKR